jgi:RecA-family ATPase
MVTWEDLKNMAQTTTPFVCDPIVPAGGIILVHGKWSVGKSPFGWHLARCVAEGEEFFGLPTRKGRVVYLEVDTPLPLVKERVDKLEPTKDVLFSFMYPGFNVVSLMPGELDHLNQLAKFMPDLVIVNTLRKVHQLDDIKSGTPSLVYGSFQRLFPGAAIMFIHHDKKDSTDPKSKYVGSESFSGSQHWADDAQCVIHLCRHGGVKGVIRVEHTKSQVSETLDDIILQLDEDGSHLSLYGVDLKERVKQYMVTMPGMAAGEFDKKVAEQLGLKERTVRKYRTALMEEK